MNERSISYTIKCSREARDKCKQYCIDHGLKIGYFIGKLIEREMETDNENDQAAGLRAMAKGAKK